MTNLLFFFNKLEGWQNTDSNLIHEILIFLQGIPPPTLHKVKQSNSGYYLLPKHSYSVSKAH